MQQTGKNISLLSLLALACLPIGSDAQSLVKPLTPSAAKAGTSSSRAGVPAAKVASAATVTVRVTAQVVGKVFTLGEIADIKGGDSALRQRLASVEVGASPLPGLSRPIRDGDVIVHLRAAQCGELLASKRIILISPPTIQISRAGQEITADEISRAALAAGQQAVNDLTGVTLEAQVPAGKVVLPTGKLILLPGACQGQPVQGTLHVPVSLIVDDKTIQTVDVTLKVHRKLTVLVARHTIEPHELVTAEDVVLSTTELPPGFTQPVSDLKNAVGKRATRRISGGLPVPADALEIPPDIAANINVTVSCAVGALTITMPGRTRQAGHIGDAIRVYIPSTGKELDATVIDDHTVTITDLDARDN